MLGVLTKGLFSATVMDLHTRLLSDSQDSLAKIREEARRSFMKCVSVMGGLAPACACGRHVCSVITFFLHRVRRRVTDTIKTTRVSCKRPRPQPLFRPRPAAIPRRFIFHEVRTPLQSLTLGIESLALSGNLDAADREALQLMRDAGGFMSDTLNAVCACACRAVPTDFICPRCPHVAFEMFEMLDLYMSAHVARFRP